MDPSQSASRRYKLVSSCHLERAARMERPSLGSKAGELFAWGCKKHSVQILHDFRDIKVDSLHGNYRQACVLSEVRSLTAALKGRVESHRVASSA